MDGLDHLPRLEHVVDPQLHEHRGVLAEHAFRHVEVDEGGFRVELEQAETEDADHAETPATKHRADRTQRLARTD
jgi:hypothetical protein